VKILLDTHAFLWLIAGDASLSPKARDIMEAADNEPLLSAASLWEMAIKVSLGKLTLNFEEPFSEAIGGQLRENGVTVLPLDITHIG
jgi:PIN domain nuclease of toxin-antitoxin system